MKIQNKYFAIYQILAGAVLGLLLLVAGAFIGQWLAPQQEFLAAAYVALGILFGYLLGVFLGVYYFGKYLRMKGSFWLTLAGGFVSVIIIVLLNEKIALNNSSLFIWGLLLILFPGLQTWGYHRFSIGKKIKLVD